MLSGVTLGLILAAPVGPSDGGAAAAFVRRHCLACHDGSSAEGGLDLAALKPDFADATAAAAWATVLRRVEAGEMPPRGKPRPPADDRAGFQRWVAAGLSAADLARRAREGRAVARRLNRVEYENTLHDLLGVRLPLAEMLPEDQSAHGFDNVAAAQEMSPAQAERYLELAGLALEAALAPPGKVVPPATQRVAFEPHYDVRGKNKEKYTLDEVLPDKAVLAGWPTHTPTWRSPASGDYKVRFSGRSQGGNGRPTGVTFAVAERSSFRGGSGTRLGVYDLTPKSRVVEFTAHFPAGARLVVGAYDLPYAGKPGEALLKKYAGPRPAYEWVEVEGPLPTDREARLRQAFGGLDPRRVTAAQLEPALRAFAARAFRRPPATEELRPALAVARDRLRAGGAPPAALKVGLKAVLVSPSFLYLAEKPGPLDGHALAARLSYFLWSTLPDAALTAAAADGSLATPAGLRGQVERMLADPKAARFTENFLGQWLGLRQIDATTPDNFLYPEFDKVLEDALARETTLFFDEVLNKNLSVATFLDSDFAFLNQRLAEVYKIPGVYGYEFRKVPLRPEYHRGGVLTQGAVLKVSANGTTTSPVVRGVWVLDHVFDEPPPPPPPDIPAVEPDIRGAKTIREQLAKHRSTAACAGCHARIDPYGTPLESFDVLGGWRENYRAVDDKVLAGAKSYQLSRFRRALYKKGPKVEPGDVLPDGRAFRSVDQFKRLLLADTDRFARGLTAKLVTYATGHHPGVADRPAVEAVVASARAKGYGFRTLIHEVVQSDLFRSK